MFFAVTSVTRLFISSYRPNGYALFINSFNKQGATAYVFALFSPQKSRKRMEKREENERANRLRVTLVTAKNLNCCWNARASTRARESLVEKGKDYEQ